MQTYLEKLRGLREDNDLTQTQVAQVLGTSQTMYARYERGASELPIDIHLSIPAELTVSVYTEAGSLVRRLCASRLTRPTPDQITRIFWDGRDADGHMAPQGRYTIAAEAILGGARVKAASNVVIR